ncbi:DUF4440 domain-containing protein [Geomicrobium sp. JSM 1781026]|uniref:DUF4440 domain-containing protein n=1 Tax=Geomicrobium sp. JSM 1781026 TaxID=3344580 RepID=UPI0035BEF19D
MNFERTHDAFIQDWHEAMHSGDTTKLENMTDDYTVVFYDENVLEPATFTKAEAIAGMRSSAADLKGMEKRFDDRVISMKTETRAVVFYRMHIIHEGRSLAELFTIEHWTEEEGRWLLAAEIQQRVR